MGLFRNAMDLLRGRDGKARQEGPAELLKEQVSTEQVSTAPASTEQASTAPASTEQASTAPASTEQASPVVATREVKREARPDPNKPGWGRTIG